MVFKFKSWVPSVAGRLSFSAIGDVNPDHPSRYITANVADKDVRFILCYQSRDTSDALVPRFVADWFANLSGKMWYLCLAKTEAHNGQKLEKLSGQLFVFQDKSLWRGPPKNMVREAQKKLRTYRDLDRSGTLETDFKQTHDDLLEQLQSMSSFHASFSLLRSGVVELHFDPSLPRHEKAPEFPGNISALQAAHLLTSQAFFFLKDIVHHHKHHDSKTDTIIDIYDAADDITWRREVLYSLYRKIIVYKRQPTEANLFSSLGIIAYAQAFKKIWAAGSDEPQNIPYYDDDSLIQSLNAARAERDWRSNRSLAGSEKYRNTVISIIGLFLAFASLLGIAKYKPSSKPADILIYLSDIFLQWPLESFAVIAVIIYFMLWIRGSVHPEEWRFTRLLLRILQPVHRLISASFALIMFLLAFSLSFWVLWYL